MRDFLSGVGLGSVVPKVHVLAQLGSKGQEPRSGAKSPGLSFPGRTACQLELTKTGRERREREASGGHLQHKAKD